MGKQMDQDTLKALAAELAKDIKSEKDLGTLTQQLIKLTVETALNAEMDEHLGYEKHAPQGRGTGNNRNSYSTKRLKGQHGDVTIQAPRDRNSFFEPQFVRKGQSHLTQMDDQILALYAKGLSTRDIVDAFKEMYDADISAGLVSKVTERVIEQVHEWQNRPLDPLYPIVYLDCIVLKIRANQQVALSGTGHQYGWAQGAVGPVAGRDRRGKVLAIGPDRAEEPRPGRHPDRVCGWSQGLP